MEAPVSTPPPAAAGTGVAVYVRFRPLSASERSPTSTLRSGADAERCVRILPSVSYQQPDDGGGSSPVSPSSSTSSSSSSFKSRRRSANSVLREVRFLGGDGATDEAQYRFAYDGIMDEESTQTEVFETVAAPLVECVLRGNSAAVVAYGQTGAGKTHTMEGMDGSVEHQGLIPRLVSSVAAAIGPPEAKDLPGAAAARFTLSLTVVEIYNEKVRDMLDMRNTSDLTIHETAAGVMLAGATEVFVSSQEEVTAMLKVGGKNRSTASTEMNADSSRSHLVCILTLRSKEDNGAAFCGRLYMADLAGCEKTRQTGAQGTTLEEAKGINKSLSALGNVIKALTEDKAHVPFRDSKLTRILKSALSGNSARTALIACCSPSRMNGPDTLSTLRFASRVKLIKCSAWAERQSAPASREELLAQVQALKLEVCSLGELLAASQAEHAAHSAPPPQSALEEQAQVVVASLCAWAVAFATSSLYHAYLVSQTSA